MPLTYQKPDITAKELPGGCFVTLKEDMKQDESCGGDVLAAGSILYVWSPPEEVNVSNTTMKTALQTNICYIDCQVLKGAKAPFMKRQMWHFMFESSKKFEIWSTARTIAYTDEVLCDLIENNPAAKRSNELRGGDYLRDEILPNLSDILVLGEEKIAKKRKGSIKPPKLEGIILPDEMKESIINLLISNNEKNQNILINRWGFGETIEKGTGLAMLFYGVPGTGKTKLAEIIAGEIGLKLKMITVADIWSSEPGAAERTIQALFAKCKPEKDLILFDECETLIANRAGSGQILAAQTNTLLQCLERYKGIVIFTTNRPVVLDKAFERRLQLKMEFPSPDKNLRMQIWRELVPKKAPLADDVCFKTLATSEIAGGHIKNVVMNAARKAIAKKEKKIYMAHFLEALKEELQGQAAFSGTDDTPIPYAGVMQMAANGNMELRRREATGG